MFFSRIVGQSSSSCCWSAGCWFWHPAPSRDALLHLLWKGVWWSRVLKRLCFWADFLSNQPFPERVTLTRMWIIIVIDTVVSEWLVTPGGGIMEEGKEFALLPPPPRLFYSLSLSLSDLLHIISAWLDIWIFFSFFLVFQPPFLHLRKESKMWLDRALKATWN